MPRSDVERASRRRRRSQAAAEGEHLRRMVDAMREMLGLGPLYAAERPSSYFDRAYYGTHGFDGDGNRHRRCS